MNANSIVISLGRNIACTRLTMLLEFEHLDRTDQSAPSQPEPPCFQKAHKRKLAGQTSWNTSAFDRFNGPLITRCQHGYVQVVSQAERSVDERIDPDSSIDHVNSNNA